MAQPYIGEIKMFAGTFAPDGWELCDGQLLSVAENDALFKLIGTTYGGDGESTFAVPDLRGRLPVHQGNGVNLAQTGGAEEITLTVSQVAAHSHVLLANASPASIASPLGNVTAQSRQAAIDLYIEDAPTVSMAANAISTVGGSQPHTNLQPYLCINFIISLFGISPSGL